MPYSAKKYKKSNHITLTLEKSIRWIVSELKCSVSSIHVEIKKVDKILWLIASGKYYDVKQIEPTIIVKSEHSGQSLRDEFLIFLNNSVNLFVYH